MDLAALKLCVKVAQVGSFAGAARLFDLDPSVVSRLVGALEDELGFRLFQRTTRHVSTTEAGAMYFARIAPVIEEMDRARSESLDLVSAPTGVIRVTTSVSFAQNCLVPLLPALRKKFPLLGIDLLMTDAVVDILSERIDLAVRLSPRHDSGLVGSKLMHTRHRVCASPEYLATHDPIVNPTDITHHQCILFPLAGYRDRWIFRSTTGEISEHGVSGAMVISNALGIRQACIDGMGLALLPSWNVDVHIKHGDLVDLFPDLTPPR